MARESIENVTWEFGGRIVHIVTSGLLLIVLTRVLGPDRYGLLALAIAVFTFARLLSESGLHWSAARYIAEFKADHPDRAATVVLESGLLVVGASTLVSLSLLLLSAPLASLIGEPRLSPLLVAGSGVVFCYSIHRYNRHILQGYEDLRGSATVHSIEGVLTLAFVVGFVLYRPTALAAVVGYVLAYACGAAVGLVAVYRTGAIGSATFADRSAIRWQLLRYNVPLTATRLSNVVDRQVGVLLVGYFLTAASAGFYALGKQIADFVRVPAASLGFAFAPTYGAQKTSGELDTATELFEESLRTTLILYVPAGAGLIIIAEPAILTVFGLEYAGAVVVVQILAVFVFFHTLVNISAPGLDYLGRARIRAIANAGTSAVNVVLTVALIPAIGVAGAAVAASVTTACYALVCLSVMYAELRFDLRSVAVCFSKVAAITAGMSVAVYTSTTYLTGAAAVAVGITIGVGIWLLACQLLALFDVRELLATLSG